MSDTNVDTTDTGADESTVQKLKHIVPAGTTLVENKKFGFRATKDELGQEKKRTPLLLSYPVPTFDGLVTALEDEKNQAYVLSMLGDAIHAAVRSQIDDEEAWEKAGSALDFSKLTLGYLANVPAAERRGGGIAKEVWADFAKNYIDTMVAATGKEVEKVEKAAAIFIAKLAPVKTNKKVISFLDEQLDMYVNSSKEVEDFEDVIVFLKNKIATLLAADDSVLLENL